MRGKKKIYHSMAALTFFAAFSVGAYAGDAPGKSAGDAERPGGLYQTIAGKKALSIEECVDIALKNQPNVVASASAVTAARTRINQAESVYFPQIEANAGYSRQGTTVSTPTLLGGTTTTFKESNRYTTGLTLKQNIYDFGKTSSAVRLQETNVEASAADLETAKNQITFNVRQAYYALLQAARNRDVSADAVSQFEHHLTQAKGLFEVGVKPKIDVTRAEVSLSDARVNKIKAENALRIARINLMNAMGIPDAPEFEIEDDLEFSKLAVSLDEAVKTAIDNRPDLRSAGKKKKASLENVEFNKKSYYPVISGSASYGYSGDSSPLDKSWNVGATITVPLFSGFLTTYQVEESKANVYAAEANEKLLRQTVMFEVRQAYLNLLEAEERVPAAELSVKQAAENLELANARYATGVGSPIEQTDAVAAHSNAKLTYYQALTDHKIAKANLEKVVGRR